MNTSACSHRLTALFTGLLLLTAFPGCSRSHQDVVAPHLAAIDDLRAKLKRIAADLPAPGTVQDTTAGPALEPAFVFNDDRDPSANADSLHVAELTESDPEMDLNLSANLVYALTWTTPEKRRDASAFGDATLIDQTLQAATTLDYLVVHRLAELTLPAALDATSFTDGAATVEGLVVRLADEAVVATYVVHATIPDTVNYEYREGEDAAKRLAAFARSALWSDARSKIQDKLAAATGGTVTID